MAQPDTPSQPQVERETRLVTGASGRQHAFIQHQLLSQKRNRLRAVGVIVETSRRKSLTLTYPAECHVRLKRGSLGREADGLTAPLDSILEQLQRRRGFDANP